MRPSEFLRQSAPAAYEIGLRHFCSSLMPVFANALCLQATHLHPLAVSVLVTVTLWTTSDCPA